MPIVSYNPYDDHLVCRLVCNDIEVSSMPSTVMCYGCPPATIVGDLQYYTDTNTELVYVYLNKVVL